MTHLLPPPPLRVRLSPPAIAYLRAIADAVLLRTGPPTHPSEALRQAHTVGLAAAKRVFARHNGPVVKDAYFNGMATEGVSADLADQALRELIDLKRLDVDAEGRTLALRGRVRR